MCIPRFQLKGWEVQSVVGGWLWNSMCDDGWLRKEEGIVSLLWWMVFSNECMDGWWVVEWVGVWWLYRCVSGWE